MEKIEKYPSLKSLAKKWANYDIDIDRLLRLAEEGKFKLYAYCREEFESELNGEVYFGFGPWEYTEIDFQVVQNILGRGQKYLPKKTLINRNGIQTYRDIPIEELSMDIDETIAFEKKYLSIDQPKVISRLKDFKIDDEENTVHFNSEPYELRARQIDCIKILYLRFEQYEQGNASTPEMSQEAIISKAKVDSNIKRLRDVFKSREKEFKALITSGSNGKFSLNIPFPKKSTKN